MSSPPPTRPTSHRAAAPVSVITRKLLPPLAAVTAVVLVILLLIVLNSRPTPAGPAPGAVAQSADNAGSDNGSPTPTPSTPSASPTVSVAPPPVSQPSATQPPARPAVVPVTVLNNSRRQGLAAHVAGELAARGWPIRRTGNFTGRIAETTVYYAPGQRAVALRLAHAFGQVRRVLPRFRGLPGSGLTLVVTRDWTG